MLNNDLKKQKNNTETLIFLRKTVILGMAGAPRLELGTRGFGARTPLQYFQGFEAS